MFAEKCKSVLNKVLVNKFIKILTFSLFVQISVFTDSLKINFSQKKILLMSA